MRFLLGRDEYNFNVQQTREGNCEGRLVETGDRSAGGIRVTDAGQIFLPYVPDLLGPCYKSLNLTGKRVEQPGTLHPPFRKTRPIVHPRVGDNPRLRA
jgi:hypothetical protein